MKILLTLATLLTVFLTPSFAMIGLVGVTPEKAKKLGIEVEARPTGHSAWVTLRFEVKGELDKITPENRGRVELRLMDGDQPIMIANLADREKDPKKTEVSFFLKRDQIERTEVWVAYGGGLLPGVAYAMNLSDFVD